MKSFFRPFVFALLDGLTVSPFACLGLAAIAFSITNIDRLGILACFFLSTLGGASLYIATSHLNSSLNRRY